MACLKDNALKIDTCQSARSGLWVMNWKHANYSAIDDSCFLRCYFFPRKIHADFDHRNEIAELLIDEMNVDT